MTIKCFADSVKKQDPLQGRLLKGVGGAPPLRVATGSRHDRAKVTRWLEGEPGFASKTLNGQVVLRLYLPSRVLIPRGSFPPEKMPEQLFLNYPFLNFTVIRPLQGRATVNKFLAAQYIMVDDLSYYLNLFADNAVWRVFLSPFYG